MAAEYAKKNAILNWGSTGTVHISSAKARLTSVVVRIWVRDLDRHQNLKSIWLKQI